MVQHNTARELTLAKRREKWQATRTINNDDTGTPILSDPDPEPSEEMVNELPEQQLNEFPACKRQALEDMMNTAKWWQWAPRAAQPSVAQVLEDYGPQYCTCRNVLVEGSSRGDSGKENEGLRRLKRNS